MKTFIRVVEYWVPDATGTMLEFGGGLYGNARGFGALSRTMCFGRGEGLPGQAWESGRPIVLKEFRSSSFRRTGAARAEGLTCGIALPIFAGRTLRAVVVIFCGDDAMHAGAIELWHNAPGQSADMKLDDGYYGTTGDAFEFMSRHTSFRIGNGLPGLVWESGMPVFMPDFGKGSRFLRADGAIKVGINRAFAMPVAVPGRDTWVMAFLSALATPIVRRFELWLPDERGGTLRRREGFCERQGTLAEGRAEDTVAAGQGAIGRAFVQGLPAVAEPLAAEPGAPGPAVHDAGLQSLIAIPVLREGTAKAVVAWYF